MNAKLLIVFSIIFSILILISGSATAEGFKEFELKWSYDVKDQVLGVYVYDLDNDGEKEIIAASNKVHVIDKDGELEDDSLSKIGDISNLQVRDLDNDGSNEIIIAAGINLYLLDKNLNIIKESVDVGVIGGFSIGDLIGDEKLEVIAGGNNVYIFNSDLERPSVSVVKVNGSVSAVYVDDFDNDSQNEIMSAGNGIYIIDNLDTLTTKDDKKLINNEIERIRNIYVSDLNKDGAVDILFGTFYNAHGIDKDGNRRWEYRTGGEVYDLKVSDLDNDGKNEVVIGATTDSDFAEFVYAFDIFGKVKWNFKIGRFKTGKEAASVEVSDLDNDGKNEVIVGSYDNNIYILDDRGNLLWKYEEAEAKINSIYISDLNNDGNKEIIAGSSDNKVYVLGVKKEPEEEEIKKNETEKIPIENITRIYISDLDNDGKNEVALGHQNYVSVLDRDFNLRFNYPTEGTVNGIYIGDVDNDTYNELVAGDYFGNVYTIGRTGLLDKEEQINNGNDIYSADLYNDGSYETIIATSMLDYETSVYCTEICCPPEVDRTHISSPPEGFIGSGKCLLSDAKVEEFVGEEFTRTFSTEREYKEYVENLDRDYYTIINETMQETGDGRTVFILNIITKPEEFVETPGWEIGRVYIKGSIQVFDEENLEWRYELGDNVKSATVISVFAADVNNDGYPEVIAGADDGNVYVINRNGLLIQKYETEGAIRTVFAADINNDNYPEIIAGSDDWFVYVFNSSGLLWKYETINDVYSVFAADLNDDFEKEVIAGSHDNHVYIFDSKGNLKLKNKTTGIIREIYAANIDDNNYKEVVLAGEKLNVLSFDYSVLEIPKEIPKVNITEIDISELVLNSTSGESIGLWDKTAGGNFSDYGYGVAVDSANNIIVAGVTNSFGAGNEDAFIIKYNSSGNLMWSKTAGLLYNDSSYGVAVDSANNIIVTGATESFGAGGSDFWMIKYDPNGNMLWNRTAGGSGDDYTRSIAVDSANNVIVTGATESFGAGGSDFWTIKYDTNGNMLWNITAGGNSPDSGEGVAVDSANNIIVTGATESFGAEGSDFWTIKYDSNGSMMWNITAGGNSTDLGHTTAVDSSDNIVVAGVTESFDAGNENVFIIKYYPNGDIMWSETAGGSSEDSGIGVAVDLDNNVVVTGYTMSFGAGDFDVWTIKSNKSGPRAAPSAPEKNTLEKILDIIKENPIIIIFVILVLAFFMYASRRARAKKKEAEE